MIILLSDMEIISSGQFSQFSRAFVSVSLSLYTV